MERGYQNKDYLTARLARDFPDIHQRLKDGKFRSVRAAAIEAGIIDPEKTKKYQVPVDPIAAGKYLSSRVSEEWLNEMVATSIKSGGVGRVYPTKP